MIKTLLLLALLSPFAARAETAEEFVSRLQKARPSSSLTFTMTVKSAGGALVYNGAIKGEKWKMTGKINGLDTTVFFNGKEVVILMMGTAIRNNDIGNMVELPDGNGYTLGEETTVAGQPCRMIVKQDEKVCIHERYVLPIYAETGGTVMTITNIRETSLPDSEFSAPAGMPVLDMGNALRFGG